MTVAARACPKPAIVERQAAQRRVLGVRKQIPGAVRQELRGSDSRARCGRDGGVDRGNQLSSRLGRGESHGYRVGSAGPDGAQRWALEEDHIVHVRGTVRLIDHEVVFIASRLETKFVGVRPGERVAKIEGYSRIKYQDVRVENGPGTITFPVRIRMQLIIPTRTMQTRPRRYQ